MLKTINNDDQILCGIRTQYFQHQCDLTAQQSEISYVE
jgi:hypothetical protein